MLYVTMASLAQARLVPIAQRYLTISTCRPDLRDHITNLDSYHAANRAYRLSKAGPLDDKSKSNVIGQRRLLKSQHEHAIPHQHHNRHFHCYCYCNTKDPLREIYTPKLISRNYSRLEALVKANPSTLVDEDILVRNFYRDRFKYRHMTAAIDAGLSLRENSRHREDEQEYRNRDKHQNSSSGKHKYLPTCVMFGFLGLFRTPTPEQLEEERTRLSDEQKIKKMKPIELAIARGVLSMCDQNYEKANGFFHDALHMAQDENDEERLDLVLNLIASNYFESGDFKNAEKLFIDLMKRMVARDVPPTSPAILELSLKLASIYSKSSATSEKALKGFKFVIGSLLNNLDDIVNDINEVDLQNISDEKKNELALLGWGYDWFAKHLLMMNDYTSAATMLQKAYEISSKVLGPLHDQTLILLNDIGTTLAMNNSPDEGRRFIEKAVEGAKQSKSVELSSFYVNLGLVYLNLKDLREAKKSCEESMNLAKKNPEHYNSQEVLDLSKTCLSHIQKFSSESR